MNTLAIWPIVLVLIAGVLAITLGWKPTREFANRTRPVLWTVTAVLLAIALWSWWTHKGP